MSFLVNGLFAPVSGQAGRVGALSSMLSAVRVLSVAGMVDAVHFDRVGLQLDRDIADAATTGSLVLP
jgi:hypothetical protein